MVEQAQVLIEGSHRVAQPAYRRILVKISGEALSGPDGFGIHQQTLEAIATDLVRVAAMGVELAVVVGGGNIFRGVAVSAKGVPRPTADTMGMLATVMNAIAVHAAITAQGKAARALSALEMPEVCDLYTRGRAIEDLAQGRIVVLAAGTGNPYFTTDTTAVLRAAELDCEIVFKATDVDGVYSADPKKDAKAKRYETLTHDEALNQNLKVMDSTAFALARENRMPIIVFSIREAGAIEAVLRGKERSTRVG